MREKFYIYMYICMYVGNIYIVISVCMHIHIHANDMSLCVYAYIHICIYIYRTSYTTHMLVQVCHANPRPAYVDKG